MKLRNETGLLEGGPERTTLDLRKVAYPLPQAAGRAPDIFIGGLLKFDGAEREWVLQSDDVSIRRSS